MNTKIKIFLIGVIVIFTIMLISAFAILPLEVYIIRDIATLYNVEFITSMSKGVIFGVLIIIGIIKMKVDTNNKDDDGEDFTDKMIKPFLNMAKAVILLLFMWFMAYLIHGANHL
jgi:hypothetical protein